MVRIVTDSVADIPSDIVEKYNIVVVPMLVQFGSATYRDRIDITSDEFYNKLKTSDKLPTTSAPSPGVFAQIFDDVAEKCNEIIGVFLTKKLSMTFEAATQGIKLMKRKPKVELIDSQLAIMGQGLIVIEAAKNALAGASFNDIKEMILRSIPKVHVRVRLDTLEYLARGGRIGKVQVIMGSLLKMSPILGIKNGEAFPIARVRTKEKATEWLFKFATSFQKVKSIALEYGTNLDEAKFLAQRIASVLPKIPIYLSNMSPVIGTHTGPSVLGISLLEE